MNPDKDTRTPHQETNDAPAVAAFIVCCNEEDKIRRCLDSVKWCAEIVVIDSGSTDRTLEICREYTDKIVQRPWPGYVAQKRFALHQCTKEWILNLDADEEVSPELHREIVEVLQTVGDDIDGFHLSRVVFYLDRWWRKGGWYPEYRLRLCRRARTTWGGEDPHEKALVPGKTRKLRGELRHYTYTDITQQVTTLNKYSSQAARSLEKKGRRPHPLRIFLHPPFRFLKFYIVRKGFLEGFPGFVVAILESYYVFLKHLKHWELERTDRRSITEDTPPDSTKSASV